VYGVKMQPELVLIDADILVYQALSSVEKAEEYEQDVWIMTCDHREGRDAFNEKLSGILKHVGKVNYVLCFSDGVNFRKELDPTYKSNRKKTRKPMGFVEFKNSIMDRYPSVTKPRLEADDIIGILATKPGANAIVVSDDKDLMQIPGKHLIDGEIVIVTKEQGERFHMLQTMTGDPVDGYPGCPGIGKVKAEKIFGEEATWLKVLATYEANGLTEEDALLQARLAKILQWENWDSDKQEVILWSLPTTA
jgi:DNA polymerase-1